MNDGKTEADYALEGLLRIRRIRASRAEERLAAAQRARELCAAGLERCRRDYADWKESCADRRDCAYGELIGASVRNADIELVRWRIAEIDGAGARLADGVTCAETDLAAREQESAHRRADFAEAVRDCEKIVWHKSAWAEELCRARERESEADLEEFTGRKVVE